MTSVTTPIVSRTTSRLFQLPESQLKSEPPLLPVNSDQTPFISARNHESMISSTFPAN